MNKKKISIAICTYRRFDWLMKCLENIKRQTLANDEFDIFVIDNSLQPEESKNFKKGTKDYRNLKYIITDKAGLSYARNIALEQCGTQYIAFIDDDALAKNDWAEKILKCFERYEGAVGIIGGKVNPIWEKEKPEWIDDYLSHDLAILDWGDDELIIQINDFTKWLVGANICYDVKGLKKAGGFPEQLGRSEALLLCHEELAVNEALRNMGYLMVYCPDVIVDHLVQKERISLEWICTNAFWEGVSYKIYQGNQEKITSLSPSTKRELNHVLDGLNKDLKITGDSNGAITERDRYREAGHIAMEEHGYLQKEVKHNFPCIYIATPCLNTVHYIDQCIESVISQAGDFYIRYHIHDGNSDDGTISRLTEWKKRLDSEEYPVFCRGILFTFTSNSDRGMYDAISKGFVCMHVPANAAMTWINSDDYLMPGALAAVQKVFSISDQISWVIGSVHTCNESSYPVAFHQYSFPRTIIRAGLCDGYHWQHVQQEGVFWRKSLWDKVGGLNISFKFAGDWDLWRRFAEFCTPVQTVWPLGCFRNRPDQMSTKDADTYNNEVASKVSFKKRQAELHRIVNTKEKIHKQILTATRNKNYEVKESFLVSENIPGCTLQNCPDLAIILLNLSPSQYAHIPAIEETFIPPNDDNIVELNLANNVSALNLSPMSSDLDLSPVPEQPNVFFVSGWHSQGSDSSGWWQWSAGMGTIHLKAHQAQNTELFLTLNTFNKRDEIAIVLNGKEIFNNKIGFDPHEFGPLQAQLRMGTNIVSIFPKKISEKNPSVSESQIFMVKNFRVSLCEKHVSGIRDRIAMTRMVKQIKDSRLFFSDYYFDRFPDLNLRKIQPEFHYLLYGAWENMNPNPLFNSSWYLRKYTDVYLSGMNPMQHFMLHGWKEGRDPHPEFSTNDYLDNYDDVKNSEMNPLIHYLAHGIFEGRNIYPSR